MSQQPILASVAVAALCMVLAGCSPASASGRGTTGAQTAANASSGVAATTVSPAEAGVATATADPAPPDPTPAEGAVRLVLDASASQASYHAHEQLVGKALPNEAVGTTRAVSGAVVLDANGGLLADQSLITVDLTSLQSDESRRDNFIQGNTLQTSQFPTASFVPRQVQGLPTPLPTSGQTTFQLLGDLTVHGVTQPVSWQVAAQFGADTLSADATTTVRLTDFGLTPPKAGPVLSIEDPVTLELTFTAARQA